MRLEFEVVLAYAIAIAYTVLTIDKTASFALFNMLSFAAPLWIVLTNIGSVITWLFISAGIFFYGQSSKLGRKLRARTVGAILFFGIWFNVGVAFVLKNVLNTARPPYELSVYELGHELFGQWLGGPSMPSGHAQIAFMAAVIIGHFYPRVRIPLFVLAVLIALSRIGLGAHWIMDVLFGAANGLLIAFFWLKLPWKNMGNKIRKLK